MWYNVHSVCDIMCIVYVICGCLIRNMKYLPLPSTRVHPRCFHGVSVAHRFSVVCCPTICLYVLSSVLWWPLRFPHNNDVRFVFTFSCLLEGSGLIYVICVCSVRLYLQLFVGGLRSYLCYLCLFGSSLPPVVCKRVHVLFMLFVFVRFVCTSSYL